MIIATLNAVSVKTRWIDGFGGPLTFDSTPSASYRAIHEVDFNSDCCAGQFSHGLSLWLTSRRGSRRSTQ